MVHNTSPSGLFILTPLLPSDINSGSKFFVNSDFYSATNYKRPAAYPWIVPSFDLSTYMIFTPFDVQSSAPTSTPSYRPSLIFEMTRVLLIPTCPCTAQVSV